MVRRDQSTQTARTTQQQPPEKYSRAACPRLYGEFASPPRLVHRHQMTTDRSPNPHPFRPLIFPGLRKSLSRWHFESPHPQDFVCSLSKTQKLAVISNFICDGVLGKIYLLVGASSATLKSPSELNSTPESSVWASEAYAPRLFDGTKEGRHGRGMTPIYIGSIQLQRSPRCGRTSNNERLRHATAHRSSRYGLPL